MNIVHIVTSIIALVRKVVEAILISVIPARILIVINVMVMNLIFVIFVGTVGNCVCKHVPCNATYIYTQFYSILHTYYTRGYIRREPT